VTRSASGYFYFAVADGLYGADLALIHDAGFGDFARAAAPGVLRRLPPGAFVVELGCGSGILTEALVAAGHEVLGVDVSPAMLELASRRVPHARFELGSLHHFFMPECDAIVAVGEVVSYGEHNLGQTFRRWAEALRPGGLALFDAATTDRQARSSWRSGEGWTIAMEASREGRLLTRRIETSRRIQGGGWRRDAELHVLRLHSSDELLALLSEAGLAARVLADGYGGGELPPGIVVFEAEAAAGDG
jgi:SAM-dependent methyltransferase